MNKLASTNKINNLYIVSLLYIIPFSTDVYIIINSYSFNYR